eukprot:GHVR01178559.1.p2 GENE.GHVR01178559.1~~GHVR01178559.1.p2  ORF type:complete len:140 (+),score=1.47 GHVR01178559.1:51-470(+)
MKFIESEQLSRLTALLQGGIDCGDRTVDGRVELFDCARGPNKKRLCNSITNRHGSEGSTLAPPLSCRSESASPKVQGCQRPSGISISPCLSAMPDPLISGGLQSVSHDHELYIREILVTLISTMNEVFSGYDFRSVKIL